ncbi:MAG: hypothetical protein NMK33_00810 [Candidatus Cardinium sp.]|uniref:hypothetical protein n=1 Tax=Cardinium endosymbiont of Dermatophagoides farinae TaxID=2597823 RepID=UPI001CB9AD94|nr:hypothetical protein [Cardinium endosymbiont of Dermatophagoides farinae]UWW97094.1 MAG: hypothetical protein NMK33_00810 [Candidatus Cardinium sp.]
MVDPIFTASLFLTHCTVILLVLPIYIGTGVVAAAIVLSIYPVYVGLPATVLSSLFPLFIATILMFIIIICFKVEQNNRRIKILYFENQEKVRENQQLKSSLYDATGIPSITVNKVQCYGAILNQVVHKIEESISFLDENTTLYKKDFQSIINKFYDWISYFNRREVEVALAQEVVDPPKLLVEKSHIANGGLCAHIVCDIHQVVYLLVQSVLLVGKIEQSSAPVVRIQLHPTSLKFTQSVPIDNSCPTYMDFPATALVVSQAATSSDLMLKVKTYYIDVLNITSNQWEQEAPPSIDLQMQTMSTIVEAHYGYLESSSATMKEAILLVLPNDVTQIFSKMTAVLPIDSLTLEQTVTPKEQADSMMELMQFHDYACKSLCQEDPIDVKEIARLLLLLRKHFGFRRHASNQLFYVRAVGIAKLVVDWVFHSHKVVLCFFTLRIGSTYLLASFLYQSAL